MYDRMLFKRDGKNTSIAILISQLDGKIEARTKVEIRIIAYGRQTWSHRSTPIVLSFAQNKPYQSADNKNKTKSNNKFSMRKFITMNERNKKKRLYAIFAGRSLIISQCSCNE